jgi:hypothetical protein
MSNTYGWWKGLVGSGRSSPYPPSDPISSKEKTDKAYVRRRYEYLDAIDKGVDHLVCQSCGYKLPIGFVLTIENYDRVQNLMAQSCPQERGISNHKYKCNGKLGLPNNYGRQEVS